MNDLYVADPDGFVAAWQGAFNSAVPWAELEDAAAQARGEEAWEICSELAQQPRILDLFVEELRRAGVVGEDRYGKLLYLSLTSRFFDRPISMVAKGLSSTGKSHTLDKVLTSLPDQAYYALTSMSERLLAYDDEPIKNRMLVLYEKPLRRLLMSEK